MDVLGRYGHIRGFNYVPSYAAHPIALWRDYDAALVERELDYARRLGLNSARVFLSWVVWDKDRGEFLDRLVHFTRAAHARGISTMPVVWDSCTSGLDPPFYDFDGKGWVHNPGPDRLVPEFWGTGEEYCADLVEALAGEPGLEMWDVHNEPVMTGWLQDPARRAERLEVLFAFVEHFCQVMRRLDPDRPVTVGTVGPSHETERLAPFVDVITFHDYSATAKVLRHNVAAAMEIAERHAKPLLLTELGCPGRANPYDRALELVGELGIGWYLWELMIGCNAFAPECGIFYPDGTVRDPSIVAAVLGFFRRRQGDIQPVRVDMEGAVTRAVADAGTWLAGDAGGYEEGLELAERMAHLLEAGELVPMAHPPTAAVAALASRIAKAGTAGADGELRALVEAWRAELAAHCEGGGAPLLPAQ